MPMRVTIVSGFLGSGKTSYLREALAGATDAAVFVNELRAVGLDHHLLLAAQERTELVGGGCACCVRRADLVDALRRRLADMLAALNPSASIRTRPPAVVAERSPSRARAPRETAHGRAATGHTADVQQLSLDLDGTVDWLGFAVWLSMLLHAHGDRVLR